MMDLLITFLLGFASSTAANSFRPWLQKRIKDKRQRELLHFEPGELRLVFPHTGVREGGLLPTVSTEDSIAVLNISRALTSAGLGGQIEMRDAEKLMIPGSDERKHNLILLGGPKTNPVTRDLLRTLSDTERSPISFHEISSGRWELKERDTTTHESPSFNQLDSTDVVPNMKIEELRTTTAAMGSIIDVAVIASVQNPWKNDSKVLLIAGLRGIGTWGAAKYLRKESRSFYAALKNRGLIQNERFKEFWAVLEIRYEDYDIEEYTIRNIIDVDS